MKTEIKTIRLWLAALIFIPLVSEGKPLQGGPFGLGVILGEPSAVTGKYHLDREQAIDGGIAFHLDRWFLVYSDFLVHFPGAFGKRHEFLRQLTPYFGLGLFMAFSTRSEFERKKDRYFESGSTSLGLGMRIPMGLEWRPQKFPVGVFLELAPGLAIVPGTWVFIQGGIGARFYF